MGDTAGLPHVSVNHWYDIALTLWLIDRAKQRYPPSIFWMYCYLFHEHNNHEERLEWESLISGIYARWLLPCEKVSGY